MFLFLIFILGVSGFVMVSKECCYECESILLTASQNVLAMITAFTFMMFILLFENAGIWKLTPILTVVFMLAVIYDMIACFVQYY